MLFRYCCHFYFVVCVFKRFCVLRLPAGFFSGLEADSYLFRKSIVMELPHVLIYLLSYFFKKKVLVLGG